MMQHSSTPSVRWLGARICYIGFVIDWRGRAAMLASYFYIVRLRCTLTYTCHLPRTSVPTPTLPYVVLVAWLGACVPASWLGHSRKLAVFWIAGVSTLGGGTTYRVRTYASRKTAVFWNALPVSVIRDAAED